MATCAEPALPHTWSGPTLLATRTFRLYHGRPCELTKLSAWLQLYWQPRRSAPVLPHLPTPSALTPGRSPICRWIRIVVRWRARARAPRGTVGSCGYDTRLMHRRARMQMSDNDNTQPLRDHVHGLSATEPGFSTRACSGIPRWSLAHVPAGRYWVQAVLHPYECSTDLTCTPGDAARSWRRTAVGEVARGRR